MRNIVSKFVHDQKGLSLVEMSITIGIMGIVFTVATILIVMNSETIQLVHNQVNARFETRGAMRTLRNDLQKISQDSLLTFEDDQLTFYDINGNYVKYNMVGTTLQRNNTDLLKYVTSDPFSYLDEKGNNYNGSVNENLAFIEIELKIEKKNQKFELKDRLYVRN